MSLTSFTRKEYWIEGFAIAVLLIIIAKCVEELNKHVGTKFGDFTILVFGIGIGIVLFIILSAVKIHRYATLALSLGIGYAIAEYVLKYVPQ